MAVYVSSTDEGVSGSTFYRSEEYQLPAYSTATWVTMLTSTVYQTLSFADNCNLLGVVVQIYGSNGIDRSMKVALEENSGGWVERASVTLTADQIISYNPGSGKEYPLYIFVPFVFASSYAVTTVAATWRLAFSQTGGSTGNWYVCYNTSGKTQVVRICINDAATGTPGASDTAIIKNTLTLDTDWELGGTETISNVPWSLIIANGGSLILENPPLASYTLELNGLMRGEGDSVFRVGTSTDRIASAQQFTLKFTTPGASKYYGFSNLDTAYSYGRGGGEMYLYGERPNYQSSYLESDAESLQKVIVLHDDTSAEWQAGDTIEVSGGATGAGVGSSYLYCERMTIDTIVGSTITFTSNLSYKHYTGATVARMMDTDYGIRIIVNETGTGSFVWNRYSPSNTEWDGVYVDATTRDTLANQFGFTQYLCQRAAIKVKYVTFDGAYLGCAYLQANYADEFDHLCMRLPTSYGPVVQWNYSKNFSLTNSQAFHMSGGSAGSGIWNFTGCSSFTADNIKASSVLGGALTISFCIYGRLTNISAIGVNYVLFNGSSTSGGIYSCTINGIFIDVLTTAVFYITGNSIDSTIKGLEFGNSVGATALFELGNDYPYIKDTVIHGATNAGSPTLTYLSQMIFPGKLNVHSFDGASEDHRCYSSVGYFQSTGTGLADTTVHTAGGYALRFQPTSSTTNLEWSFTIPTGNIQNKTMMIGVWCKINSATYYAGTYQLPRITVNYDNGTTAYTQASQTTDWQFLPLPFTPITTYGQITVTLSGRTDATTTDAYVYWDDFVCSYPPNSSLDLGSMDYFADALPVTPPIALPLSAGSVASSVWESLLTTHTTTGSFGKQVGKKLLTLAKFIGVK